MMYAKLWDKFYSLIDEYRRNKTDIKDDLFALAKIVTDNTEKVETLTDYRNMANIYYQCQEMLLLNYDESIPQQFPSPDDRLFDLSMTSDEKSCETNEITEKLIDLSKNIQKNHNQLIEEFNLFFKKIELQIYNLEAEIRELKNKKDWHPKNWDPKDYVHIFSTSNPPSMPNYPKIVPQSESYDLLALEKALQTIITAAQKSSSDDYSKCILRVLYKNVSNHQIE